MIQATQKIAAVMTTLIAIHIGQSFAAPAVTAPVIVPTTQTSTVNVATKTANQTAPVVITPPIKPATLETQFSNLNKQSKIQTKRLDELEVANRIALTRNQTLQLENDNLSVQVKVLQSDRGAQMFIYGAVAILVGALIGYVIASNFLRRTRRW
ncbi:MAG: hypothetical protein H7Z73_02765 [Candidatus Saccharibacteria bacterium]|nr:hypothetical protein [Moraxellaceae bacterium]